MDLKVRMTSKLKNYYSSSFVMPKLVEKDTSFVLVGLPLTEILNLMFSRSWSTTILDFKVRMTSELKNSYCNGFVMLKLVEKDTSFVLLPHLAPDISHFMLFKMALAAILNIML